MVYNRALNFNQVHISQLLISSFKNLEYFVNLFRTITIVFSQCIEIWYLGERKSFKYETAKF